MSAPIPIPELENITAGAGNVALFIFYCILVALTLGKPIWRLSCAIVDRLWPEE